jgi:hypothetical protein
MKATLDLPDELYHKVESFAAQRGETVTAVVADALSTFVEGPAGSSDVKSGQKKRSRKSAEGSTMAKYVKVGPDYPSTNGLSEEEWAKKWDEDEAAFLKLMKGPDLDPRSAVEIIREGRR